MTEEPIIKRETASRRRAYWITIGGLAIAAALVVVMMRQAGVSLFTSGERDTVSAEYVDPAACYECHSAQHNLWLGSHHQLAMQPATEETVLGDFADASFVHGSETTLFFRRDGEYFINAPGPDGTTRDYPVRYTFGIEPLQQYLIDIGDGKLHSLTVAWNVEDEVWYHLQPDEYLDPSDPLHWTQHAYNGNARCIECHTTNWQKGYDLATDTYKTTWSEVNVGCQACHGPGSRHVALARAVAGGGRWGNVRHRGFETAVTSSKRAQVETCARCHARRYEISAQDIAGQPLLEHYRPASLDDGLYHSDGQILDEVYVYGSFVQSKMYHAGVRCSDCHDPHTTRLRLDGDALCTQCHQPTPRPGFEAAAGDYGAESHHFHANESGAPGCVDCHMPETTYMGIDPRRDHSFSVPRPDLTVSIGTPNACTNCHLQGSVWASDKVREWYGEPAPHFAPVIEAARRNDPASASDLLAIAASDTTAAIVRVTALRELPRFPSPEVARVGAELLDDDDAWVRVGAVELVDALLPTGLDETNRRKAAWLSPLLSDPFRAVRIVTARALVGVPASLLTIEDRAAFEAALAEYRAAQEARADWAGSHLNLGAMHAAAGQGNLAEQSYQTALRLDPAFVEVRFNLANLYNAQGRNDDAQRVLEEAIQLSPDYGEAYYSLGLLLAEIGDMAGASANLERATELLPARPRVRYNWALALDGDGRRAEAIGALRQVLELSPDDLDALNALVVFHAQEGEYDQALQFARRLARLQPQSLEARQMVGDLERRLDSQ